MNLDWFPFWPRLRVVALSTLLSTVAGLGLAYCYEEEVSDALAAGRLVTVLSDWSPTFAGFHLYYPSRHQLGQGLRALLDMLKAHHSPQY